MSLRSARSSCCQSSPFFTLRRNVLPEEARDVNGPTNGVSGGSRWYRRYGLNILSDVVPFGLPLRAESPGDVDLFVHWDVRTLMPMMSPPEGEIMASRSGPGGSRLYTLVRTRGGYVLRLHGLADFAIDNTASHIVCNLGPDGEAEWAQALLSTLVLAFVLSLRGRFVLHASAVVSDGRAVAIAGRPNSGKTSLAALLCAGGASLFADDFVSFGADWRAIGTGPGPELRLRPATAAILTLFPPHVRSHPTCDGRIAFTPPSYFETPTTLSCLVLPERGGEGKSMRAEYLRGAQAVRALASAARITGWVDPDQQRRFFEGIVGLAARTPILRLMVPWGTPFSPLYPEQLFEAIDRAGGPAQQALR